MSGSALHSWKAVLLIDTHTEVLATLIAPPKTLPLLPALRCSKVSSERNKQSVLTDAIRPEWDVVHAERQSPGRSRTTTGRSINLLELKILRLRFQNST
jgi:hypothetical protein